MKTKFPPIALASFFASFATSAWADTCLGGLRTDGPRIVCDLTVNVDGTEDGQSLASMTAGIVRTFTLTTSLQANVNDLESYLQTSRIAAPEQIVDVRIETNGSPVILKARVAPYLTVRNTGGRIVVAGAYPNVTSITGNFVPWVMERLRHRINTNKYVRDQLMAGGSELVSRL